MQVDNGYKPLRVSLIMLWISFSQPIISPSHPEDENEVNLCEVAQRSGYVNGPLQVLRAGSQFDCVCWDPYRLAVRGGTFGAHVVILYL